MDDQVQTVEIIKQPGQTLGFYIREGNGIDRWSGVFVSRIAQGSVVAKNSLLRVNDEILSVNSIDVQRMSLDDVVILMSIARRLVLTIRMGKNYKTCSQIEHAEVISPREQAEREGRQPVVILKSGFNSSSYSDMSVDERSHERLLTTDMYSRQPEKQMMLSCGDVPDVYNSPPRYNVTQLNATPMQSLSPRQLAMEASGNLHFPQQLSGYSPTRNHPDYAQESDMYAQQVAPQFGKHRRTPSDQIYCTVGRTSVFRGHDWMDGRVVMSDTGRMMEQALDRTNLVTSTRIPQPVRVMPNGRVCQIDQYNSDSEATPRYQKSKSRYRNFSSQLTGIPNDMERNQAMLKSMTLSRASSLLRKRTSGSFADLSSLNLYGESQFSPAAQKLVGTSYDQTASVSMPMPQDDYNLWLNRQLLQHNSEIIPNAIGQYQPSMSQQLLPNYRLTRKLSTDSLIDYKTYQMESTSDFSYHQKLDNRLGSWISSDVPFSKSGRQSTSMRQRTNLPQPQKVKVHSAPLPSTSTSNAQTSGSITQASSKSGNVTSKNRGNQLSRIPIKIQTEQFVNCPTDVSDASVPLTGSLNINILCGHGLKSTKTALRDLYCVVEIDSMPVARTMVRTGALNFDWDEQFDVDVVRLQKVQFLVYSWDPDTRHQLCFTAAAPIAQVVASEIQAEAKDSNYLSQSCNSKVIKLAIKLDPKGTLYVEISFTNVCNTFRRSNKMNVFGVELKEIIQRERSGSNVPLLVQRCVREIERRGLGQLGLYRLSGSTKRKQQLKEEFEKNVRLVDLSADGVSDVNVLTSVLKDYFKELPEPLCSNSLYEMLLDALSVQMPGDIEGNTQLMLGILECLPRVNQDTLASMLDHLKRVAMKSEMNKMTTQQLGICLGPALICPALDDSRPNTDFDKQGELLKCLLDIWQESGASGGESSGGREKNENFSQEHWTQRSKLT